VPYNNEPARRKLLAETPWLFDDCESKVLSFINLCIYPQKFELLYNTLRNQPRISANDYESVKGAITGMLVMNNRQHRESMLSVDNYVIDFIKFIRSDPKDDPVRFLLSMRRYFPRFLFAIGINVAFGLDWKTVVTDCLDLSQKPNPGTYHGVLCHRYLRNLLYAYIIWKTYREPHDPDYKLGENDLLTLFDKYTKLKTCLGRETLQSLYTYLSESLPSWNVGVRQKAAWAIDSAQDGYAMVNRQFTDWKYKQVQG